MSPLTPEQKAARAERMTILPAARLPGGSEMGLQAIAPDLDYAITDLRKWGVGCVTVLMYDIPRTTAADGFHKRMCEIKATEHIPLQSIQTAIDTLQDYLDERTARGDTHTPYAEDMEEVIQ